MSSIIAHGRRNFKSNIAHAPVITQLLDADRIAHHCRDARHRWRRSFWSPHITLLTFVLQVANPVKSLRAAVADVLAFLLTRGDDLADRSADPSAFAQARRRLPLHAVDAVFRDSVDQVRAMAGEGDRWCGLRIIVIDGSNISTPDTIPLQNAFPQPKGQARGCGFPIINIVTLFDWRSGAAIDFRTGSQHESEAALFRRMFKHFGDGDVALADRYYCSYVDIARLVERGADVIFRLHARRSHDFRSGVPLDDTDDRLVTWRRPDRWLKSFGVTREEFEKLPEEMTLRMLRTSKTPRGFRSRQIVIVTSILDPQQASRDQLLALYRDRWLVELNIRSLKTTLGMEFLRGKSADVAAKEVLVHLLLYNMLRLLMWNAARTRGVDPQRLSFAGTLHRLQSLGMHMLAPRDQRAARSKSAMIVTTMTTTLLRWIADDAVPDRPNRTEPRRVKRRPKNYSRLTKPRSHYRRHGDESCR